MAAGDPQGPLLTRRDLLNHGAGSALLDEYEVRSLGLRIEVGGALGAMSVSWRFGDKGTDAPWSEPKTSQGGSAWTWDLPDPAWASVTFAAGSYSDGAEWVVRSDGSVAVVGGSAPTVTAARNDIPAKMIQAVSDKMAEWMQNRIVAPILSLPEGLKGGAASWVIFRLKTRDGMTPQDAGVADDNIRAVAEAFERDCRMSGASAMRPPGLVDSSGGAGAGLPLMPLSDPSRCW